MKAFKTSHCRRVLLIATTALIAAVSFYAATTAGEEEQYIVRRGDTISYLAFKMYGKYDDSILRMLKQRNRHIKNLDRLRPGQKLYFPALAGTKKRRRERLSASAGRAVLTYMTGEVLYKRKGRKLYDLARPNMTFRAGDAIQTGRNGRAELILDNKSVLRLDEHAQLTITELTFDQGRKKVRAGFKFSLGDVWVKVTRFFNKEESRFALEMPTAIAGVQGTTYSASVARDSSAVVRVFEGTVEVKPATAVSPQRRQVGPPRQIPGPQQISLAAWVHLVRSNQEIRIPRRGAPQPPRTFDPNDAGNWIVWNQQRDRDFAGQ